MKFHSDSPTKSIVAALREAGATVYYWKAVSRTAGVPDLIVGYGGTTWLFEVKSATGKLSEKQEAFHAAWRGGVIVTVRTPEQALAAIGVAVSHLDGA